MEFNFETPSKQSSKGLIVIFFISLVQSIRKTAFTVFLPLLVILNNSTASNKRFYIFMVLIVILLFILIRSILEFNTFKFHLTATTFILNKGILNKEELTIPLQNIQNVTINQNFIQQFINVVGLRIETSGANSTELEIKALDRPKANALKALLQNKTAIEEQELNTNTADLEHQVSLSKLILEGLTENHLSSSLLITVVVAGFYRDISDFIGEFLLIKQFEAQLESLKVQDIKSNILVVVILAIAILIVGIVYSVVKTVTVNFDLKFSLHDKHVTLSKGLFNRIALSSEKKKIQSLTLRTNRLKTVLDLYKISFQQINVDHKNLEQFSVIGLTRRKAESIILDYYPNSDELTTKVKPEKFYVYKLIRTWIVLLAIFNGLAVVVNSSLFWINIPLLFVAILDVVLSYKNQFFSIDDKHLIVGSGGIVYLQKDVLQLNNIQAITITQTLFQKRKKLVNLKLFLGDDNTLTLPYLYKHNALSILDYIAYKIES